MKQKITTTFIALLLLAVSTTATAQAAVGDKFKVDKLYYKITSLSPATVEVAPQNQSSWEEAEKPTGDITIPKSITHNDVTYAVTRIGNDAFKRCRGLTNVTIQDSVTEIGDFAFMICTGLTTLTIPESVTKIGDSAFRECNSLTSATIPSSVTSMGNNVFFLCKGIKAFYVAEDNPKYTAEDGVLFDKEKTILLQYPIAKATTAYSIFDSVTEIGRYAFIGCQNLTNVTIPTSVRVIREYAFNFCTGLTFIIIPASVTSIGGAAFLGCSSLTDFTVEEANTAYSSEDGVLFDKDKTTLLEYPAAKAGIYSIPASVTKIRHRAFYYSLITSITIPAGVTSIGDMAFYGCNKINSIICKAVEPPTVPSGNYVFVGIPKGTDTNPCTLYVPMGSKALYEAAAQWQDFAPNIVESATGLSDFASQGIQIQGVKSAIRISIDTDEHKYASIYNLTGSLIRVAELKGKETTIGNMQPGIYIVRIGNAAEKVVVQ